MIFLQLLFSTALLFLVGVVRAEPSFVGAVSDHVLSSLMLDIDKAGNSERLVAVGDRGYVIWSDDFGKLWQYATTPTDVLLTAVDFPSGMIGYAVGHDAVVLKTRDGGKTWSQVYEDREAQVPLLDVFFIDTDNGFVMGGHGYLRQTFDGGKTWKDRSDNIDNPDEFHYNGMTRLKGGMLLLVGEAGTLYRSGDNGKSWDLLSSPYKGTLFGVQALARPQSAIIYGLLGNAYITNDNGKTWQKWDTGTDQTLFNGLLIGGDRALLVGGNGTFSHSDGKNTKVGNRPRSAVLTGVIQAADGVFVVTGEHGVHRVDPGIVGQ